MEDYRGRRSSDTSVYRRPRPDSPDLEPYDASGSRPNDNVANHYDGGYGSSYDSGSGYDSGYDGDGSSGYGSSYGSDYADGIDSGNSNGDRPFARTTRPRIALAQNSPRPSARSGARQAPRRSEITSSDRMQASSNDMGAQDVRGASRPRSHSSQSHSATRMTRLKPWLRLAALVLGIAGIAAIIILAVALSKANSTVVDLQTQNSILGARNAFLESKNTQDADTSATSGSTASTPASTTATSTSTTTTAVATGVEDPWVASGTFTTGNAELDADIKSFCDYLSDPSASATDNAYTVYLHVSWYDYVERDDNQNPQGPDWAITYALQLYNENGGNCYEFVAFCAFCLQYFGIDAVAQPCFIEDESGGWGDHGLVLVTMDGTSYICDLSKSSKGWMLPGDYYTYQIQDIGQGNI